MKLLKCAVLVLLISLTSCSKEYKVNKAINQLVNELKIDTNDKKYILFIPTTGCSTCLTESLNFFEKNKQNSSILFVAYGNLGRKYIASRFPEEIDNMPNFYIDENNLALQLKLAAPYPIFLVLNEEREYEKHIQVFPKENVKIFEEISAMLLQ